MVEQDIVTVRIYRIGRIQEQAGPGKGSFQANSRATRKGGLLIQDKLWEPVGKSKGSAGVAGKSES